MRRRYLLASPPVVQPIQVDAPLVLAVDASGLGDPDESRLREGYAEALSHSRPEPARPIIPA
ncbi:MAG: hypothetical protein JWP04_3391 [Belnapia sp.]|nr:hypothetical protein [Belnapia sp.]